MNDATSGPVRVRAGLHVYVYLYLAVFLLSVAPVIFVAKYDPSSAGTMRIEAICGVALVNLAFWFARSRCSTSELSAWNGLLLIAAYMSYGVGSYSALIAIPATALAIVLMFLIAVLGVLRGDPHLAPRLFHRLIRTYHRNRMHQ